MTCNQCEYFKQDPGTITSFGRCRRYPPTNNGFPLVRGMSCWCGEFKQKELPPSDYMNELVEY